MSKHYLSGEDFKAKIYEGFLLCLFAYNVKVMSQLMNQGNLPPKVPSLNDESVRFQVELEFVQCLANPNYLNFLAQHGYLKENNFVNYLKYLLYWKEPEYVKYLRYPQCIYMLELLQYKQFRAELVNTPCAKFIEDQMLLHWQFYTRKRIRMQQAMMDAIRQRQENQSTTDTTATSTQQNINMAIKP
uniref:Mediator of RNA polymerase II transcription subunit 31 n=1 Tax=Phallusia mammillata TaxID=59560 RepID=A0A6F9DLA2_9ASCI|nr:mediator of RNA polymerase II transcription subunit 31-like [Phallusia mammillata]